MFVGLENGLEGLLHISELADHKVENPEEIVKVGDQIEVKILRVDADERKIGLSRKRVDWAEEDEDERAGQGAGIRRRARPPQQELKGGVGGDTGPLIKYALRMNRCRADSDRLAAPPTAVAQAKSTPRWECSRRRRVSALASRVIALARGALD